MKTLMAALAAALVATAVVGVAAPPVATATEVDTVVAQAVMTPTEKDAQSKLTAAGYAEIRDIKSGPESVTAKAVKDGRSVVAVVDSAGKVKEQRAGSK